MHVSQHCIARIHYLTVKLIQDFIILEIFDRNTFKMMYELTKIKLQTTQAIRNGPKTLGDSNSIWRGLASLPCTTQNKDRPGNTAFLVLYLFHSLILSAV